VQSAVLTAVQSAVLIAVQSAFLTAVQTAVLTAVVSRPDSSTDSSTISSPDSSTVSSPDSSTDRTIIIKQMYKLNNTKNCTNNTKHTKHVTKPPPFAKHMNFKKPEYVTRTKLYIHSTFQYLHYKVTVMYMVLLSPRTSP
jgi:hypothetical protein